MSYLGYVVEALMKEDRDAAARRIHRRRRIKREREQAVLDAAAAALPKDLDLGPSATDGPARPHVSPARLRAR